MTDTLTNEEDVFSPPHYLTMRRYAEITFKLINKHDIDMSFHELRHLNASIMLSLGIPDKYAMERGGWSTDNVLKSVYQQTLKSEREILNNKIDEYFNKMIADSNDLN